MTKELTPEQKVRIEQLSESYREWPQKLIRNEMDLNDVLHDIHTLATYDPTFHIGAIVGKLWISIDKGPE